MVLVGPDVAIEASRGASMAAGFRARGLLSASTLPWTRSGLCRAAFAALALVLLAGSTPAAANAPALAGPTSSGAVALTFDDGWHRGTCRRIAQALRAQGA